jgi:hypothetical protein
MPPRLACPPGPHFLAHGSVGRAPRAGDRATAPFGIVALAAEGARHLRSRNDVGEARRAGAVVLASGRGGHVPLEVRSTFKRSAVCIRCAAPSIAAILATERQGGRGRARGPIRGRQGRAIWTPRDVGARTSILDATGSRVQSIGAASIRRPRVVAVYVAARSAVALAIGVAGDKNNCQPEYPRAQARRGVRARIAPAER